MIDNKQIELKTRWDNIRREMEKAGADGMLVTSNVNLYYLSGRVFSGLIYLPVDNDPIFFVRRPVGISGERVVYIRKPEDIAAYFSENGIKTPSSLMLEDDSVTFNEHLRYAAIFPGSKIINGTPVLRHTRSIKSPYEIEQLRISGRCHTKVYEMIPALYRPGMTDNELSIEIERQLRLNGSLGIFRVFGQSMEIFIGSVLTGANADNPSPYDFALGGAGMNGSIPIGANGTVLEEGTTVMVDMGGNFTGYMTDMTRVFSVGITEDIAYQAHDAALEIQRRILEIAREGTPAKDIYNLAVDIANESGLAEYFMGFTQKAGFVGHGIGIEINEPPVLAPRSKDVLRNGMVFALEPKFVIPNIGAVGIENSFVITESGIEQITLAPEKIIQLG